MDVLEKPTRKQQIQEKATALFKAKGYAASSMRDLAQVLGIEAASLYSHINSKEEILQNICFRMADSFFKAMEKIRHVPLNRRLEAAIKAHFGVICENINASAVFFHEWRHLSEPHLSQFLSLRSRYEQFFMDIIQEGVEKGLYRRIDEKFAMMTILSAVNWTHQWYRPQGKMSRAQVGDQLSELLISGLRKPINP